MKIIFDVWTHQKDYDQKIKDCFQIIYRMSISGTGEFQELLLLFTCFQHRHLSICTGSENLRREGLSCHHWCGSHVLEGSAHGEHWWHWLTQITKLDKSLQLPPKFTRIIKHSTNVNCKPAFHHSWQSNISNQLKLGFFLNWRSLSFLGLECLEESGIWEGGRD